MKEFAAGGFVYRKQRGQIQILLITDRFGYVTFPKGKVEVGEEMEEAALREIREETGVQGRIVQEVITIDYQYEHPDKGRIEKKVVFYLVEAVTESITPQWEEIDGASWYDPIDAYQLHREKGYQNQNHIFRTAFSHIIHSTIASKIDHTLLGQQVTQEQVEQLCIEAELYQFASVCIPPCWVPFAKKRLDHTNVKVCTVIGFPLGFASMESKICEAKHAIEQGAIELDMVLNLGFLRSGYEQRVIDEIASVVEVANGKVVKVILETGFLSSDEIVKACKLAEKAGAHYVKTSTGFATSGATVEEVQLMKRIVGDRLKVKASGGIRDRKTAQQMIAAGADRIGSSSGIAIVT